MNTPKSLIPGLKASHQMIEPGCRGEHGSLGAFDEAVRRIRDRFESYVDLPSNSRVTWHLVITREDEPDESILRDEPDCGSPPLGERPNVGRAPGWDFQRAGAGGAVLGIDATVDILWPRRWWQFWRSGWWKHVDGYGRPCWIRIARAWRDEA